MKTIGFRAALKLLGANDIALHKYRKDSNEMSGFLTGMGINPAPFIFSKPIFEAGQTYYVSYNEYPTAGLSKVMYRTAKDRKDYTGGINQWNFEKILEDLGYKLK